MANVVVVIDDQYALGSTFFKHAAQPFFSDTAAKKEPSTNRGRPPSIHPGGRLAAQPLRS
jgi:hypothetical protein